MNAPLLVSTFLTVFLAELGDKTQLATVAISGTSDKPLAVFLGSASAASQLARGLGRRIVAMLIPSELLQLMVSVGF